jgi:hypothetical protein
MSDIEFSPTAQLTVAGVVIAAIVAAVIVELPELKRYLKIRSM